MQTCSAAAIALCLIASGCGDSPKSSETAAPVAAPPGPVQIERMEPNSTAIKAPFNVRSDGQSALAVFGKAIPGGSVVLWNDQPLETSGGGTFVAAVVPAKLYESPGTASIKLRTPNGMASDSQDFTIYGKTGPEPKVVQLYPGTTTPGKGFNLQPSGESALGVAGENFLPGVTLVFDGRKLTTVFGKGTGLSAVVPRTLIATAGSHRVWAVNPDGKVSNKIEFTVAP
ncbi:MAG: hypothetical protein ABJC09_06760 [Terriglobia bacterium]